MSESHAPVSSTPPQFDFGAPFTYVFDDPRWLNKILFGGLFYLAGAFIIGWFFVLGYVARVARNLIADHPTPLPEWDDLGGMFVEGARLVGVVVVYVVPAIFLSALIMIPAFMMDATDNEQMQFGGALMMGCIACIFVPLSLAMLLFLPASLLFAAVEQNFGAAFAFGRIWTFIKANIGNYLLAIVVYLIARFIGGFGLMLLCIGVIFTAFWSFLITTHGFAQVYRLSGKQ